ncbi:MAG: hypothetical protein DRN95_05180, partial [Candidatus Hydrothermarchaeota archaeon]
MMLRWFTGCLLIAIVLLATIPFSAFPVEAQNNNIQIIGYNQITAPAVSSVGGGALINISLTILKGRGNVYVSTGPLTEIDMQASANMAAQIACKIANVKFTDYDFLFRVETDTVIVGGPSAGAEMTILAYSILSNREINRSVMMTGMINPDGSIGPVGGIEEKAEAAALHGIKLFLVPLGQSVIYRWVRKHGRIGPFPIVYYEKEKINLTEYALEKWGLVVKEVRDIYEALSYFFSVEIEEPSFSELDIPDKVYDLLFLQAEEMERNASLMYDKVSHEFEKIKVDPWTRRQIKKIIDNSLLELNNAKDANDPYFKSSSAFRSLVYSTWAYYLIQYVKGSDLEAEVDNIRNIINISCKKVGGYIQKVDHPNDIGPLISAVKRAYDAKYFFSSAVKLWEKDIYTALYKLSYSKCRAYTALLWLELLDVYSGNYSLSPDVLKRVASSYLSNARIVVSYSSTILKEMGFFYDEVDEAFESYNRAKELFSKNEYLGSLAESTEALALAEFCMARAQIEIGGIKVRDTVMEYAKRRAYLITGVVMNITIPIPSIIYLSYAEKTG